MRGRTASHTRLFASLGLAEKHKSVPCPLPASPATLDGLTQLPRTLEKEEGTASFST